MNAFKEVAPLLMRVVLILVLGSLLLALYDENCRPAFLELAKLALTGLLGWLVPHDLKA